MVKATNMLSFDAVEEMIEGGTVGRWEEAQEGWGVDEGEVKDNDGKTGYEKIYNQDKEDYEK